MVLFKTNNKDKFGYVLHKYNITHEIDMNYIIIFAKYVAYLLTGCMCLCG